MTAAVSNLAVSEEGPVELPPSGAAHGAPLPDSECLATMEELTEENYVEFQSSPSLRWSACLFSEPVVRRLLAKQFEEYVAGVRKADCAADLRRRIGAPARERSDTLGGGCVHAVRSQSSIRAVW